MKPRHAARALRAACLAGALALVAAPAGPAQPLDASARAAQEKEAGQKLEAVRAQLKALAEQQRATRGERGEALGALREHDLALAAIAREVQALDERAAAQQGELDRLEQRRADFEAALRAQRAALAALLRSAYALGQHEELKLLLQQDDVAAIARVLAYHRYFQRAQTDRIERMLGDLRGLAEVEASIRAATDEIGRTRAARAAERERLLAARAERERLLAALDAELKDQAARLAALGKDEGALRRLLEQLRDVFADIPPQLSVNESFAATRGRLPWPLKGKLAGAFGAVDESGRRSSGILLAAPAGSAVQAVSRGRVAFADWLRGYGLMIIVDHGDGYLSLYGGNESLLRGVGDWVDAGQTIATSGASGGQKAPALYFELRARGEAVDPRGWLRK